MKDNSITKARLDKLDLPTRFSKLYSISIPMLREILIMLDIDSFLGKQRFYRMSNKVIELWGIYISPRKLKYMHTVFKNYEKAYKKVKGGGKIVGGFSEHLYNNK